MCRRLVILFGALFFLAAGCESRSQPPNVLLIVIDTLRADRLGCYGNEQGMTPFLDGLAERGVLFENAYAASSWTSPSVASLFTSRYPSQHQVTWSHSRLNETEVTLAEKLKAASYVGGGFSANLLIGERTGFGQGFDSLRYVRPSEPGRLKTRGPHLQDDALEWLDRTQRAAPRLLYLQYMEPHSPYEPPEPFRSRFLGQDQTALDADAANGKLSRFELGKISEPETRLLESLYDGEVAAVDSQLASLFSELERRGFLQNSIVVVTADHGEEFGDHGSFAHGMTLYNEAIHVPLIVLGPGIARGKIVSENVSLVDLAPTLLDFLGLPPEPRFEGRSLASLWQAGWLQGLRSLLPSGPVADVISELLPKAASGLDLRKHQSALIRESVKLLARPDGTAEVYDLAADPKEQHPDPPSLAGTATDLQVALQAGVGRLARSKSERESVQLDEATREKLHQLGYPTD